MDICGKDWKGHFCLNQSPEMPSLQGQEGSLANAPGNLLDYFSHLTELNVLQVGGGWPGLIPPKFVTMKACEGFFGSPPPITSSTPKDIAVAVLGKHQSWEPLPNQHPLSSTDLDNNGQVTNKAILIRITKQYMIMYFNFITVYL